MSTSKDSDARLYARLQPINQQLGRVEQDLVRLDLTNETGGHELRKLLLEQLSQVLATIAALRPGPAARITRAQLKDALRELGMHPSPDGQVWSFGSCCVVLSANNQDDNQATVSCGDGTEKQYPYSEVVPAVERWAEGANQLSDDELSDEGMLKSPWRI